ncbi:MAG: NDP-sugar synthase, partial [Dehalococcoidales bacterium]|nr:NDP-sugar synthase [Dehalococcoidales bacterium]
PEVLTQIPPQTNFSFEHDLFPLLLDQGEPVYAYPSSAYWIDIGTPEKYLRLNKDLLNGKSNQYSLPSNKKVIIGETCHIHPTAQIAGPAVIGSSCTVGLNVKLKGPIVIGPGCVILDDSVIAESIIWQAVNIGRKAEVKGSIIASNCHLGDDSIVEEAVLGDNVTVASGHKLKPGSKIWPRTTVS